MPTYYEILKIQPTATSAEIESACEAQYNQWRRLVTHHDPNVVNQANNTLQTLETIRSTLTDPNKRSIYDTAIGSNVSVGGLVDPLAIGSTSMPSPAMTPPVPSRFAAPNPAQPNSAAGLWVCPKCKSENPAQTLHCFKCGTELVRKCPECSNLSSLVATGFCGTCGYKFETATRRAEIKVKIASVQQEMYSINQSGNTSENQVTNAVLIVLWIFGAIAALTILTSVQTLLGVIGLLGIGFTIWQHRSAGGSIRELPAWFSGLIKERGSIGSRIGGKPNSVPVWGLLVSIVLFLLGLLLDRSYGASYYNEGIGARLTSIAFGAAGILCLIFAFFRTRATIEKRRSESTVIAQAAAKKGEELRMLEQEYQTLALRRTES
jgi:hypothetical protein